VPSEYWVICEIRPLPPVCLSISHTDFFICELKGFSKNKYKAKYKYFGVGNTKTAGRGRIVQIIQYALCDRIQNPSFFWLNRFSLARADS